MWKYDESKKYLSSVTWGLILTAAVVLQTEIGFPRAICEPHQHEPAQLSYQHGMRAAITNLHQPVDNCGTGLIQLTAIYHYGALVGHAHLYVGMLESKAATASNNPAVLHGTGLEMGSKECIMIK
jgi:hypothetical protein